MTFRDLKYSTFSTTSNTDSVGGGNMGQSSSSTNSSSVWSGSGMNNKSHGSGTGQRNLGKQREDDTSNDEEDHPPDPPSSLAPAEREIVHCADIELSVLINNEDKGHFLRVITKSKVCLHIIHVCALYLNCSSVIQYQI